MDSNRWFRYKQSTSPFHFLAVRYLFPRVLPEKRLDNPHNMLFTRVFIIPPSPIVVLDHLKPLLLPLSDSIDLVNSSLIILKFNSTQFLYTIIIATCKYVPFYTHD